MVSRSRSHMHLITRLGSVHCVRRQEVVGEKRNHQKALSRILNLPKTQRPGVEVIELLNTIMHLVEKALSSINYDQN